MHVIPRRCKLLLKPYFPFGKKRQNKIAPITGVHLTLKIKKNIYSVYKVLWQYLCGGKGTSLLFFGKARTNKSLLNYTDAKFRMMVQLASFSGFVQAGTGPSPHYRHGSPNRTCRGARSPASPCFTPTPARPLGPSLLFKNPGSNHIHPTCLAGLL